MIHEISELGWLTCRTCWFSSVFDELVHGRDAPLGPLAVPQLRDVLSVLVCNLRLESFIMKAISHMAASTGMLPLGPKLPSNYNFSHELSNFLFFFNFPSLMSSLT